MHSDWIDLLRAFTEEGVKFLVVGGYAVMEYTEPRYTKDLDLWIATDPDNARAAYTALARFGAPLRELEAASFEEPGIIYQFGMAPVRVDILTSLPGVEFAAAWPNRTLRRIDGLEFPIISLEDLVRNKRTVNRPQDRADVRRLERSRARRFPG